MERFLFGLNAFSMGSQSVLYMLFISRFTGKRFRRHVLWAGILLLCAGDCSVYVLPAGCSMALTGLLLYGMSRWGLHNSRPVSCAASMLAVYTSRFSYGIVHSLESLWAPYGGGQAWLYGLVVLAGLAAAALCAGCYALLIRRFSLGGSQESCAWLLLPLGAFFFAAEWSMTAACYGYTVVIPAPIEADKHLGLLALQLLGLAALFAALYTYKRACEGFQAQEAVRVQKSYVAQAQRRYEETRAFRHDMKNHLIVLEGLLKARRIEQAEDYVQQLTQTAGVLSFPCHTGNPLIDILLGDKLAPAQAQGVKTEVSFIFPRPCAVEDVDLCILFSNALDNAVHACVQAEGARYIRVTGERQGGFYRLLFENTCLPGPLPPMGTGLSNIKTAVEKYGGAMTAEKTGRLFRLHLLLNLSLQE